MTLLDERERQLDEGILGAATAPVAVPGDAADLEPADLGPRVQVGLVAAAAMLSTCSAVWVVGGLLREAMFARVLGLLGAVVGVGIVALSHRLPRPTAVQLLVLPAAMLTGAIAIAPAADGGTANLPGLVSEVLGGGGLLQTPLPFDPGWRFILVVLFAVLGATTLAAAVDLRRPKVAAVMPLPMTVGAGFLQPDGAELTASTVGIFLVVAAVAVAYGAQLATTAQLSTGFELRRLLRGAGLLSLLMLAMTLLAQTPFLFPEADRDKVIPPREPPSVPLEPDRELFHVTGQRRGPWRIGVLDTYNGTSWLLPAADPKRNLPAAGGELPLPAGEVPTDSSTPVTTKFLLIDLKGRSLPVPSGTTAIRKASSPVEYDPQVGVPQLRQRVPRNFTYETVSAPLPSAAALNEAPPPDTRVARDFAAITPPPSAVAELLAEAPPKPFDRLQFLRDRLYNGIIAAGAGTPEPISPARVAEMLEPDTEATPFEITAAEALLARWAGIPSRIGFGYHGGEASDDGFTFRPKHGAAWLEVYFEGSGWVPLVGTPPQAKSSLSEDLKNDQDQVTPSEDVALQVLIPFQRRTLLQLFEVVRYWIVVLLPALLSALALWVSYPVVCKALRRSRRRRWAPAQTPAGRVLVAYADLRDRCIDVDLGDPRDTPVAFHHRFEADAEHRELAWAVTRVLWGDLRRETLDEDAEAVEAMAQSVRTRIIGAQTPTNRLLGAVSKASLREPWNDEVPNFWPRLDASPLRLWRRWVISVVRHRRQPLLRQGVSGVLLIVVAIVASGCVKQGGFQTSAAAKSYPARLAPAPPDEILGYQFVRQPAAEEEYHDASSNALVTDGHVYTIEDELSVEGSLQVALFRGDVDAAKDRDIQRDILQAVGGTFSGYRIATTTVQVRRLVEQDLYIWFPPSHNVMVSIYLRKSFPRAEDMVRAIVAYQLGTDPTRLQPVPAAVGQAPLTAKDEPTDQAAAATTEESP